MFGSPTTAMGPSSRQLSETKCAARLPPGSPLCHERPEWSTGTCASAIAKAACLAHSWSRVGLEVTLGDYEGSTVRWKVGGYRQRPCARRRS